MDARSLFHRDISARVHQRTETQDKLQEANYFRHQLKEVGGNRDHFRWNLTAFISAARSVTYIMQKEYAHRKGFSTWYSAKRAEMRADPILRFLHDKRNEVLHTTVVQVHGRHRSEVHDQITPLQETVSVVLTKADGTRIESAPSATHKPVNTARQVIGKSQFIWTFRKFPNRDVVSIVDEVLAKLERLVGECTKQFG